MPLLPQHRSHDYRHLIRRWRAVARASGLRWRVLCQPGDHRVHWLASPSALKGAESVYLSAGVHGDEPAAAAGLLLWAEQHVELLKSGHYVIFPCLNPEGLIDNTRLDARGEDLNRLFHRSDHPVCGPWSKALSTLRLRLAICLHEDYDAQGCYLYELSHHPAGHSRPILDRVTSSRMPVDARSRIDGRRARHGIIQRKRLPKDLPGLPEAVVLYEKGCPVSITFETPSEFDLDRRARAHARFVAAALKHHPA